MNINNKKKGIKSGTLRRAYNDSIEKRIVCRNQIIITLASMESDDYKDLYTNEQRLSIVKVLLDNGYEKQFIKDNLKAIINQVTDDYMPTKEQINKFLEVISNEFNYEERYIKDSLFKCLNIECFGVVSTKKDKKRLGARALKRYIYETEQIKVILEDLGCHNIKYDSIKNKYKCSNPDGDKIGAIEVNNNAYLGVINWTRDSYDNRADILTLVKNIKGYSFNDTITYLHGLLGLNNMDLSSIHFESIREDNGVVDDAEKAIEPEYKTYPESVLKKDYYFNAMQKSWYEEGITEEARAKFGVLLSVHKEHSKRGTIIPLRHYETGEILGISLRRSMDDELRKLLGINKYHTTYGYPKKYNVYGLWENRESIIKKGYCCVFEAEKATLKRYSVGDDTAVSIQGHILYDKQAEILVDLGVDIIISMDEDISLEEIKSICSRLKEKGAKKVYYTYNYNNLLNEKESVADRPDVFDVIMNNKVLYDE